MLDILSKIQSNPTTEDYQQLMLTFLKGIIEGVRAEPDPHKADWKYHCIEEIILEHEFLKYGLPNEALHNYSL